MARRLFALCALSLALVACDAPKPPPTTTPKATLPDTVKFGGEIFASTWAVTIVAHDALTLSKAKAQQPAIEAAMHEVERQLSLWERDSELSRFNRTVWTKDLPVTPGLHALLETALQVGRDTDGAFDITIGPLLDVWGFSASQKGKVTSVPTPKAIEEARARTGLSLVHLAEGGLRKDRADVVVDLTAIGDGAAAAAVMNVLRERGFNDVLVDVAGEVVVSGNGLKGPWRVGINVPAENATPEATEKTVTLATSGGKVRALSTSGTYREAYTVDGKRYPHILDPRTAAPVTHNLVSCTIVADDLVVADALSTGCIALGVDDTKKVMPRFAGASALFLTADPLVAGAAPTFTASTTDGFPALQ